MGVSRGRYTGPESSSGYYWQFEEVYEINGKQSWTKGVALGFETPESFLRMHKYIMEAYKKPWLVEQNGKLVPKTPD